MMGKKFNPYGIFVKPEVGKKIDEVCQQYLDGKISRDECIEKLAKLLDHKMKEFAGKFYRHYAGKVPFDDIISECLMQIVEAVDRFKRGGNYKHHVLLRVFMFSINNIKIRWGLNRETPEMISIYEYIESNYDEFDDVIKNEDYEEIDPALIISEKDIYEEVEVRDFISKLEPHERTVLELVLDGYTNKEIARITKIAIYKVQQIKNLIREKAERYFKI